MKNMKGFIITWFDWAVWRHPRRCSRNILVLFYNLVDLLLLDRRVLGEAIVVAVSFSSDQIVKRINFAYERLLCGTCFVGTVVRTTSGIL
jgi:hypothetical protein